MNKLSSCASSKLAWKKFLIYQKNYPFEVHYCLAIKRWENKQALTICFEAAHVWCKGMENGFRYWWSMEVVRLKSTLISFTLLCFKDMMWGANILLSLSLSLSLCVHGGAQPFLMPLLEHLPLLGWMPVILAAALGPKPGKMWPPELDP